MIFNITIFICSMVSFFNTLASSNIIQTNSGFYLPVNQRHVDSRYLGYGDTNSQYGNKCHLANDYSVAENTSVYAVADGKVESASLTVGNYGGDTPAVNGGAIIIRHATEGGEVFYALYGHVKNFLVAEGDYVVAGQQIGSVGPYVSNRSSLPHLHFGINSGVPSYSGYSTTAKTATRNCTGFQGFVDPEVYLNANTPTRHDYQGAGSLIKTDTACFGCSYDVARTHPTAKGMVSFQWMWDSNNCDHINIWATDRTTNNAWRNAKTGNPLTVGIIAGSWDSREQDKYYVATLPISIGHPRQTFNIAAVMLPSKNVGDVDIYAQCSNTAPVGIKVETSTINKEIPLQGGAFWSGQGSVISGVTFPSVSFGRNYDEARLSKQFGNISFQWQPSNRCESLKIYSGSNRNVDVELSVKGWSEPQNQKVIQNIRLPYILNNNFGLNISSDAYYVFEVKDIYGALNFDDIYALCIDN